MPFVYVHGLPQAHGDPETYRNQLETLRWDLRVAVARAMSIEPRIVRVRFVPDLLEPGSFIDVQISTTMFDGQDDPEKEMLVTHDACRVIFLSFKGKIPVEGFVANLNKRSQAYLKLLPEDASWEEIEKRADQMGLGAHEFGIDATQVGWQVGSYSFFNYQKDAAVKYLNELTMGPQRAPGG